MPKFTRYINMKITNRIFDIIEETDEKSTAELAATQSSSSSSPTCIIRLIVRFRYQLRFLSNEGKLIVVEDVVTPELSTSLRIPVMFPLSAWGELYLADALKSSNLMEPGVRAMLQRKISDWAESVGVARGNRGFSLKVKVRIVKDEILGKEERDKIASVAVGLVKKNLCGGDGGGNSRLKNL